MGGTLHLGQQTCCRETPTDSCCLLPLRTSKSQGGELCGHVPLIQDHEVAPSIRHAVTAQTDQAGCGREGRAGAMGETGPWAGGTPTQGTASAARYLPGSCCGVRKCSEEWFHLKQGIPLLGLTRLL